MNFGTGARVDWASKLARLLVHRAHEARQKLSTWLRSDERVAQRAAATLSAVVLLHAVFLTFIVWGLRLSDTSLIPRELHISFYGPQRIERPLAAPPPDVPVMQPPDIVVADDTSAPAYFAAPPASVLAPRADPAHSNAIPTAGDLGIAISAQATVVLTVVVSSAGTIMKASVVHSSGQSALDAAVEAFVKDKWRFLPAMLNGFPIQYATTVAIPVSASG